MTTLWPRLEPLLPRVSKPARYIGCEDGMQQPTVGPHLTSWLLAYPDTYEIGLPNQGLQILYELLNERPDASAERTYAPWIDLEAEMRAAGLPLFSVDTHRAAGEFDIIAFNLSAELVYTNVLNCIDLAGLEVRSARRSDADPLIGAGGHCAYNPEPLADFVDFFVIGDGEEVVSEITEAVGAWKRAGKRPGTRAGLLRELAGIEGVYVPAMYEVAYDGPALAEVTPSHPDVPPVVVKRTVADLADWPYPRRQLVPVTEVVHDRLSVEVFRGCTRGCRFCQAGMITRPVRERPAAQVREMVATGLERSGYDEVSLMSLSTADYSGIADLVRDTVTAGRGPAGGNGTAGNGTAGSAEAGRVSVSLPSLRVDAFTVDVAAQVSRARRTGLTFAPEAGSWRLRQIINKLITEEDLYGAVRSAYSQGWHRMKLYFLTGLPSEMDPDNRGHRPLGRGLHPHRAGVHQAGVGDGVAGRLRAQAADAVPVVRAEPARRAGTQGAAGALRTGPQPAGAAEVARPGRFDRRGHHQPRRPPYRGGHRIRLAARRHVPGVERALRSELVGRGHGGVRPRHGLVRASPPRRARGAALGPHRRRAAPRFSLAGLAGRLGRARPGGLSMDPVLRLRGLH